MKASEPRSKPYEFDGFRLDTAKRLLLKSDDTPVPLMPKAFETLLFLITRGGQVVSKDELLANVWPDTVVEENNLTQHISALRRALGERPGEHRFIVTVPGHGYKFVADLKDASNVADIGEAPASTNASPNIVNAFAGRFLFVVVILIVLLGTVFTFIYFIPSGSLGNLGAVRSVAVLPFKPISSTERNESLELGMTEALITKLAAANGLTVRPLTAVRRYDSSEHDAVEAGRQLKVEAVLDSSIQISNGRVRVVARLLSVNDSKQLWAGQFDENLTDIFSLQDSISERVAKALKVQLSNAAERRYTDNVEAYQLYLRGRFHMFNLTPAEIQRGLGYFERAAETDPKFALAYSGISDAHRALALSAEFPPIENFGKSLAAAEKAKEIDPNLAEPYGSIGMANFWFKRDWAASEAAFKQALDLDPNSPLTRGYYAHLLSNIGRHSDAMLEAERARAIDPDWPWINGLEGLILLHAGENEAALARLEQTAELNPNMWLAHLFSANAYINLGRYEEAIVALRKANELNRLQTIGPAYEGFVLARTGKRAEAQEILRRLLRLSSARYVPPYHLAIAYHGLGEKEEALDQLERGLNESDLKLVFLKVDRIWDDLRSEARFVELMRTMKLE